MSIDQKEFDYVIEKIDDGFIFEAFGYEFLAAVLGYDFIPTGGTKDRGVDGFYLSYLARM
jgi:hypothetical protein